MTNYYGARVSIDSSDHLNGVIDPESGQGAFGYEYFGSIPRKRWIITRLDLLCAQEVGYLLRPSSAFAALTFPSNSLSAAAMAVPFSCSLIATGGIPFYHWDITAGALPPGLRLDSFTGMLTGTPTTNGTFNFTVRVRDYHEGTGGLPQNFTLNVAPPPLRLGLSLVGQGTNSQAQLVLFGAASQQQVIQVSNGLITWTPIATNTSAAEFFQLSESNPLQFRQRFYRAVVVP